MSDFIEFVQQSQCMILVILTGVEGGKCTCGAGGGLDETVTAPFFCFSISFIFFSS
jgi:hypothetical protein